MVRQILLDVGGLDEIGDNVLVDGGRTDDALWYKDAIIYEVPVRAFFDGNGDGLGDFHGLSQKLDYLSSLGVTCVWLLPFFSSPLRDDGYDVADYRSVHPGCGTLDDFKAFVGAAHARGIRVLIELVLNHTSDQHEWFQRARLAPPASPEREYYVWSDSDQRFSHARIVFVDGERSNWTWDPAARAYYWHRFFYHQPDLNYDNPRVLREMLDIADFWLDAGADGFRLDAAPYLVEREGTSCENLPETHAVLKAIRRHLDARGGGALLAEANQRPDDIRPYFGDGDECHMVLQFPLMPRLFMAMHLEDPSPIVEIMAQMPEIPAACQWALFLRNHDELTLEMVTDDERAGMHRAYGTTPRARLHLGLRRRLAPLLGNSRPRIELLNALLFSFPGTPIVYYGDEIGMGDDLSLDDRAGLRTPMQWTAGPNGGFSRGHPHQLYSPVIADPVYGFHVVNVESQEHDHASLLHWMKNIIRLRKRHHVFGRGSIAFLQPSNPKVLAYIRRLEDHVILCVANLSSSTQPVELELGVLDGRVPVDMLGDAEFPPIGTAPYCLTLRPYGFHWFDVKATRLR